MTALDALMPAHAKVGRAAARLQAASEPRKIALQYQLNPTVLERIWLERLRQKELFRAGKISFQCDSPVVDPHRKLAVLTEELGEVAKEVLEAGQWSKAQARRRLQAELTQVAAVTIAWLEALEDEK